VLDAVLPEGAMPERLARLVRAGAPADPVLRLAALLDGDALALAERLRLSIAERDRLVALRAQGAPPVDADDAELRRRLADTAKDILIDRVWLAGGDAGLRARLAALEVPVFPLQGRDLRDAGVEAGPLLGALLRELREWWLDGGCTADRDACLAELERVAASGTRPPAAKGQGSPRI
jgi:poly(A) polymerase